MNRAYVTFIVVFILVSCKEKSPREIDNLRGQSVYKVVDDIAKTNIVMGSVVGYEGKRPAQWTVNLRAPHHYSSTGALP